MLELQKKRDISRNIESLLIGLIIQESAMARQIESIERRALRYDELRKEHQLWQQYDSLMDILQDLMQKITDISNDGFSQQCSNNTAVPSGGKTNSTTVSSILSGVNSSNNLSTTEKS